MTKINTELTSLAGLAQTMEKSTDETLQALADLLEPAANRLYGYIKQLENMDEN